jgi:glc operon protein GlcG
MKTIRNSLVLLAAFAVMASAAAHAELPMKKMLNLKVAKNIAAAAEKHATANNWKVAIAIFDDGGNLLYFQKMDGVQIGSIEVAQQKALSALKFKRPTKAFSDDIDGGRSQLLVLPGAVPFEGGLPLMSGDQIVGSIGVSGVTSEQDGMIAAAGSKAL